MNKIKFLVLFMVFAITNQVFSMEIYFEDLSDLQGQNLNSQEEQLEDQNSTQEEQEISGIESTAVMLRKLTYLYENKAQELLEKISQPNQEISRVQELAYNIGFIKEILGYTNAIIDYIKLEQLD